VRNRRTRQPHRRGLRAAPRCQSPPPRRSRKGRQQRRHEMTTKDTGGSAMACNSCAKCKFLYRQDRGWSNWTVEETEVLCSRNRNPNLPAREPWDWDCLGDDNWPLTNQSACELFAAGAQVSLDVEGETHPADC